ncbi:MAG: hypothetical protein KatS3mg038_3425 [Candidatus Kapaibacterium sp.]|nr:MAG: hypothetical protein KatS3mg038_1822 [Candidatus Kapabacteria bacterium]GIV52904.1 MAG: hypothetical protein KatS3mg038_3425 [Candidatus Kapabacteria bacterium]GIV82971.1 MAG: hypothetical protein KatS3mg051_2325 [Anaerolineae bacterium]
MRPAPVSEHYVAQYLRHNAQRARPHTVGTFLAYRIRGRARAYAGHYKARVIARLESLEAAGQARRVRSACGGVAWVPVE